MAIIRKYGSKAIAGLAQKVGENKAAMQVAELQTQANVAKMQQQYAAANLDAQLKNKLQTTIADNQMEQSKAATANLRKDAINRMQQDWEVEKAQLRSQNDFQLAEKEYALKKDYQIQKSLQDDIDRDNKIKQLDKDVASGRIDTKVKRASGMTEYDELYNQIRYAARPIKQSSEDAFMTEALSTLKGGDSTASTVPEESANPTVTTQPVSQQTSAIQPVTGSLWWKKIHPEAIDPVIKAYLQTPDLDKNDRAAALVLLNAPNSQVVLAQKLKMYNRILQGKK